MSVQNKNLRSHTLKANKMKNKNLQKKNILKKPDILAAVIHCLVGRDGNGQELPEHQATFIFIPYNAMLSRAQQIRGFRIQNTAFTGCQLYFVKFVY